MALPRNTASIIEFLRPNADSGSNFTVTVGTDGIISIIAYDAVAIGQPQPTEQEIINESTSQGFLDYQSEHGGNPVLTRRRKLRERVDRPEQRVNIAVLVSITGKPKQQVRMAYLSAIASGEGD